MEDLYEALGVKRDATKAEIRSAYRKAAKKAHPDVGGSPEAFELITLAADCLGDDERRRRYDETGEATRPQANSREARVMETAMSAVNVVMQQVMASPVSPEQIDILKNAIDALVNGAKQAKEQMRQAEQQAEKWEKAAKRVHAKSGKKNRVAPMLTATAAQLRQQAAANREQKEIIEGAIDLLKEHEFEVARMEPAWPISGGGTGDSKPFVDPFYYRAGNS